jgi:hypothetical protein
MGGDLPDGYERILQEFQDIGLLELWIKHPSPAELISLQRISRRPDDVQEPSRSSLDRTNEETPLWVSVCASTVDTAGASED